MTGSVGNWRVHPVPLKFGAWKVSLARLQGNKPYTSPAGSLRFMVCTLRRGQEKNLEPPCGAETRGPGVSAVSSGLTRDVSPGETVTQLRPGDPAWVTRVREF